jgi:poly(3-hydroxybutyrate) depolymerase
MFVRKATLAILLLAILVAATQAIAAQEVIIPSHMESWQGGQELLLSGILHKPSGDGPFPAVVMLNGCENIRDPDQVAHETSWAQRLVSWGYVALQVDSFTPRGFPKGI